VKFHAKEVALDFVLDGHRYVVPKGHNVEIPDRIAYCIKAQGTRLEEGEVAAAPCVHGEAPVRARPPMRRDANGRPLPPTMDEVLAAGYTRDAAHRIVEREQEAHRLGRGIYARPEEDSSVEDELAEAIGEELPEKGDGDEADEADDAVEKTLADLERQGIKIPGKKPGKKPRLSSVE